VSVAPVLELDGVKVALLLACACAWLAAAPQGTPPKARDTRMPFTQADGDRFAVKYAAIVARTPPPAGSAASPFRRS